MKKTTFAAGLCASALSLALLPSMHSMAERNQMITWEKTGKNSVRLKLKLQDQEPADSFTAFSLKLIFESDEPMSEDPAFKFSQNIKSKLDPAVYETRYDEDAQEMTVYVADRDPVLEKGEELDLGTITVDSEENVRISVDRDDFQGVNSFHEKLEVTNFGEYEDYEMILETPEPEEPETEDPETPEPEAPDTPDEDTEDDDSDRNSGRGNSRSEWTEKPNGSWKQDGRGWWFAKLDGSYPADGWFECSWNGKEGWYHFNAEGYMETGWFTDKDGHTYFFHDQNDAKIGAMYTGWRWIGDNCYYFTKDSAEGQPAGSMVKNGKTPDGYTVNAQGQWTVNGIVQINPEKPSGPGLS